MVVLDGTIVNIALPHIQTALDFTPANLSWVVNGYTLAFGGLLLLGGAPATCSVGAACSWSASVCSPPPRCSAGSRRPRARCSASASLQGVGAAIASPTALSLITTTFPAGPARNRAIGVYAAMSGAGAAIGLILGGVLTEYSWRWTFLDQRADRPRRRLLAPRFLGESERGEGRFDVPGALTGTAGLASWSTASHTPPPTSWGNATTLTTIVDAARHAGRLRADRGAVTARAHAVPDPRRPHAGRRFVAMLIVGAAMFAMFYFLGLYIQQVLGYSSLKAGCRSCPSASASSSRRRSPRRSCRASTPLDRRCGRPAGRGRHARFQPARRDSTYLADLLPFITAPVGRPGLTFVPLTLTAVSGVANEDSGVGSAVLNTMQQVGGSIGLAT